jgi:hypothetical protein
LIRWRLKQDCSISAAAQDDTVEWLLFRDLAERLADGRISEEDLVLEHGTSEWIPADSIVGLVRAAGRMSGSHGKLGQMPCREQRISWLLVFEDWQLVSHIDRDKCASRWIQLIFGTSRSQTIDKSY